MQVILPWPDSALAPNKRYRQGGMWPGVTATKEARNWAMLAVRQNYLIDGPMFREDARLTISFIFHPPTHRYYDLDGLISRAKAYQDGIFDAIHNNDRQIDTIEARLKDVTKGGLVTINLDESED